MITIKHPIDFPDTYPLDRIGPLKDILFFDIETTGFSGETSQLYLIGCTYFDGFDWKRLKKMNKDEIWEAIRKEAGEWLYSYLF